MKCAPKNLFLAEGHAVGALIHGGIAFVGADHNAIQCAVIFVLAVVCALMNGAFNALVCFAVHIVSSFCCDGISMAYFFFCIRADCD